MKPKRLTEKTKPNPIYDCNYISLIEEKGLLDKLGQLEDIEQELGVDLISFLKEMNHVIKTSSQTVGYTTSGKKITTDYGCVEDFLKQLKESLKQ